jgi:hypothetical protein
VSWVLGSGSAEPSSTRRARGLVHPIVLTHSTGRGSKGEALLVYSACGCYGRGAADLHAMLPSLCVVVVRVFAIHVELSVCLFNSLNNDSPSRMRMQLLPAKPGPPFSLKKGLGGGIDGIRTYANKGT